MELSSLEFIGMAFAILGAILMSLSNEVKNKFLYTSLTFTLSNLAMLYVAIMHGMLGLTIQQILFLGGAAYGVVTNLKKTKLVYKNILQVLFIIGMLFYILFISQYLINLKSNIEMSNIEIAAALMAIVGNFLMYGKNKNKLRAFSLFFCADIFYAYIAYQHAMYYFMFQSIFTVFTAAKAYYETQKTMRNKMKIITSFV